MACCPVPKVGGAAAPSAPPVPTPMVQTSAESSFEDITKRLFSTGEAGEYNGLAEAQHSFLALAE